MHIRILVPVLAAATCLEFSLVFAFLYIRISRRTENLIFSLLAFFLTWMLWTTLHLQECETIESGVFWFRMQFPGVFGSVATLVHFVSLVTGRPFGRRPLLVMYSVALVCALSAFNSHILHLPPPGATVSQFHENNELATGDWFTFYSALPITWALTACALMIQGLRRADRSAPTQAESARQADMPLTFQDDPTIFSPLKTQLRVIFFGLILIIGAGIVEIGDLTGYLGVNSPINPRGIAATIFCVLTGWTLASEIVRSEAHKRELATENALLDRLARARVQAIYDAQHQVKNKLASIQWPLRNVLRSMQKGERSDRQENRIGVALSEIDELYDVLDTMLNLARVEAGQTLNLGEKKCVDVAALLQTVYRRRSDLLLEGVKPVPAAEGTDAHILQIEISLSRSEYSIYPVALRQIVFNLLDNAIKYSPKGSTITLRLWDEAEGLFMRITDRGQGLTEEDRVKIFDELFYRGRADAYGIPGTGIGLNLCKRLLEAQGGRIWAESAGEGCGSAFSVHVPL